MIYRLPTYYHPFVTYIEVDSKHVLTERDDSRVEHVYFDADSKKSLPNPLHPHKRCYNLYLSQMSLVLPECEEEFNVL